MPNTYLFGRPVPGLQFAKDDLQQSRRRKPSAPRRLEDMSDDARAWAARLADRYAGYLPAHQADEIAPRLARDFNKLFGEH